MTSIYGLNYELEDFNPTSSLAGHSLSRMQILSLLASGATGYYKNNKSLFDTLICTAEKSIENSNINRDSIDVVLFATNSLRSKEFHNDFGHLLITKLQLQNAYIQLVGFQNCGDGVLILRTAKSMIESGMAKTIMILIGDDCESANIPRILNNSYLHSDGASSCILSKDDLGSARFELNSSFISHAKSDNNSTEISSDVYNLNVNLDSLLSISFNRLMGLTKSLPDFIVTHNMNTIYNSHISNSFQIPIQKISSYCELGHCMASDVLINMCIMAKDKTLGNGLNGIILTPTSLSIGCMRITYYVN